MRGKAEHFPPEIMRHRITPAYAGKSQSSIPAATFLKDHPRLCGEKVIPSRACTCIEGSPPPMRGKDPHRSTFHSVQRITPAYAGKRREEFTAWKNQEDHPRLCGEKRRLACIGGKCGGSPPPMRGKVVYKHVLPAAVRITPAYAGKRLRKTHLPRFRRDHPRLCGEKTKKIPKQRYFFHQPASFSFSLQYT